MSSEPNHLPEAHPLLSLESGASTHTAEEKHSVQRTPCHSSPGPGVGGPRLDHVCPRPSGGGRIPLPQTCSLFQAEPSRHRGAAALRDSSEDGREGRGACAAGSWTAGWVQQGFASSVTRLCTEALQAGAWPSRASKTQ